MTYIDRLRGVVAGEDDYFSDDLLLFYLNKSVKDIVSYYTKYEIDANKPLRVLDKLRHTQDFSVDKNEQKTNYTKGTTSLIDLTRILSLSYNEVTPMKMISIPESYQLNVGQIIPSVYESYYTVLSNEYDTIKLTFSGEITIPSTLTLVYNGVTLGTVDVGTGTPISYMVDTLYNQFELNNYQLIDKTVDSFTFRTFDDSYDSTLMSLNDSEGTTQISLTQSVIKDRFKDLVVYLYEIPTANVNLTYIALPESLGLTDESYSDLPERVDNAIIYNACYNMIMQENVADIQNTKALEFKKIANEYINTNLY